MRALLKTVWLALAILFFQRVGVNIISSGSINNLNKFTDKLPFGLHETLKISNWLSLNFVYQLLFTVILFLGLDIISGNIKGVIKGPVKLVFHGILYIIGFSIIFVLFDKFQIFVA